MSESLLFFKIHCVIKYNYKVEHASILNKYYILCTTLRFINVYAVLCYEIKM